MSCKAVPIATDFSKSKFFDLVPNHSFFFTWLKYPKQSINDILFYIAQLHIILVYTNKCVMPHSSH